MERSKHRPLLAVALLAAAIALWLATRPQEPPPAAPVRPAAAPSVAPTALPPSSPATAPAAAAPRSALPEQPRSELADGLNAPGGSIDADLRIVHGLIGAFRTNFPRHGNPTGTNEDITAALTGRNRLQLALLPPDHPAINREGQLCDRWGHPFFFHAESALRMTIRSAGPDGRMWTADDAVFEP